ncbi:MAG: SUMF1/EgtB/PvdO family nonheme iron enzyme [Bacteroidota bacterium]|jgi:sulfatase modifying factor 1
MKKSLFAFFATIVVLSGCYSGPAGELVGVYPREEWVQVNPYGMNYIHYGSFTMGPNDRDLVGGLTTKSKTVTISPFYMDQHEISNNEYRQFVYWVKDSLMRDYLVREGLNEEFVYGVGEDDGFDALGEEIAAQKANMDFTEFYSDGVKLAWEEPIDMMNADIYEKIYNEFYWTGDAKFYDRPEVKAEKLNFKYYWIDLQEAAKKRNRSVETGTTNELDQLHSVKVHQDRSQFVIEEQIPIYPDTLVWVHDFTYSDNTQLAETYFWHPAYDDYPVVGVTWGQCQAFCVWRTQLLNEWKHQNGETFVQRFRLPSEAEWEFASRGGLSNEEYPWGGPYTRNYLGCPLANFKPMRGDYPDDMGVHTVPIASYSPNGYGLYNMAGNVAEWTNTAYLESGYEFVHDLNPEYDYKAKKDDPHALKRKVIRGGSWKDISWFIQCGTRSYEYQDTAKSYIGFRCVMSYLGRGKSGPREDWNMASE